MEPPQYNGGLLDLQKREYLAKRMISKRLRHEKEIPVPNLFRLLRVDKLHCGMGLKNRAYRKLSSGQDAPGKGGTLVKI
jgi:hypothetical protein